MKHRVSDRDIQLSKDLTNAVNCMGYSAEGTALALMTQHRTLQQNFVRVVLAYLKALSETEDYQYDARNEASVQFAKDLLSTPGVRDLFERGLPYV